MLTREEAAAFCLEFPLTYADTPFDDDNWVCMRHRGNRKIFAAIFAREGKIWINVKADPQWGDFWRQTFPSVIPAYHMNKKHWISIILDGSMTDEEIGRLIGDSYALTAPKKRKNKDADRADIRIPNA